jgi:hypothetical protein
MNYVHTVLCQDDFLEKVPHPSMTISLHLHFNLLPRYFFPSKLRWRKKLVLQIKITLINNDHHHQSYSLSVCLIIRLSGCGWCFVYECSLISYKHNNNYSTHMYTYVSSIIFPNPTSVHCHYYFAKHFP